MITSNTFHNRMCPDPKTYMAVLKGYFDESGDEENNPELRVVSFAGYIASDGTWTNFERLWQSVLDEFEVAFFHMKEFGPSVGEFESWKGQEQKRKAFIQALTKAVANSGNDLYGVCAVVELADLERFNSSHGQDLEGYSFCMSGCIMEILHRPWAENDEVDAFCDKVHDCHRKIHRAFQYLKNDRRYSQRLDTIRMAPISKNQSFRNVLPLQLADFAAWESRKSNESKSQWLTETPADQRTFMNWFLWKNLQFKRPKKTGIGKIKIPSRWTAERASAVELVKAAPLQGLYWGYEDILEADEHRNHLWL